MRFMIMKNEEKFQEFCQKMFIANCKERREYGEKEYKDFAMYYKYNEKFLRDYYYDKKVD